MRASPLLALVIALPVSAHAQFKPSRGKQVELGNQAAADIRKKEKVLPDTDVRVKTLRRVGLRILAAMYPPESMKDPKKKEPWNFTFDVVVSDQINAFALPGGPTFFYTGLLEKMNSEDELAAVIGHELTHVRKEHWANAYNDSMKREGLLTLVAVFGRVNKDAMNVLGAVNDFGFELPFSRRHETEADDGGFEAMVKAGFNPDGMVKTFEMLRDTSKGSGKPPEFFSTHPDDGNRIKRIQEKIKALNRTFPPDVPMSLPVEPKPKKKDAKSP